MDEFPVELHRITVTIKCIVCQKVRQDQHTTKFNRTGASKKPTAPHLTVFVGLNFLNFFLYRNIIECPPVITCREGLNGFVSGSNREAGTTLHSRPILMR